MFDRTETVTVTLNTSESGTLCHVLMKAINDSGGIYKQPEWIIALYNKLADANDKLMSKS
jgi:hypothetical protein